MPDDTNRSTSINPTAAGKIMAALYEPIPTAETPHEPALPTIEGYLIEDRIGGGAGGDVYRAVHLGSDRPLAVKLFRYKLGDGLHSKRAWRELDLLQQLRLPAIPRLIDYGTHDGKLFIATEFIEGHPLDQHCQISGSDLETRVTLLAQTADAVQTLHERGILHRDIKPSNIIVDGSGLPLLIDLGVATLLDGNTTETLTEEGTPIGSPAFMSPEQARGERDRISTRSDVYSLGATAYLLLTSDTPHDMDATLHESIRRVAQDEPRQPRDLESSLPKPLAAILTKACARKPEDRYSSTAEYAADLRRWLNHEPVEAGGLSIPQRLGRYVVKHPVIFTTSLCICFLLSTLLVSWFSVWYLHQQPYNIDFDLYKPQYARLVSRSGNILHQWSNTDPSSSIIFARMIQQPNPKGGDKIALIGYHGASHATGLSGTLCIYDPYEPELPVLILGEDLTKEALPFMDYQTGPGRFLLSSVTVADVFPDSDETVEIIAAHTYSTHSQTVLRVYALDGEVLYETWHDGDILSIHYLTHKKMIVCAAYRNDFNWKYRGFSDLLHQPTPIVCFGLLPEKGRMHRSWIDPNISEDSSAPVVWYQCLMPPSEIDQFAIEPMMFHLGPAMLPRDPTRFFSFVLFRKNNRRIQLTFVLDENGQIVTSAPRATDAYLADPALPESGLFYFGSLPPVEPAHR